MKWMKLLIMAAIVVFSVMEARALLAGYVSVRSGSSSRWIDSYLPNIGELGPALLRNPHEARRFLMYYAIIDRQYPSTPGVNELQGYCAYYSGDIPRATAYFERALRAEGASFAAKYDLGVIYYQKAEYDKAAGYFQDALSLPEEKVLEYVMSSRVISQLRAVNRWQPADVMVKIRREYADARRFIRLCLEKQGKSRELLYLAARYSDILTAWSANGGQPETMDLVYY
jgi:tetratricopeptide (TPR) repeat protein